MPNKIPSVSVIMTSFNHERYLSKAIESISNQTFGDFELIILDDGSEDNSRQIITDYASRDSRIKTVFHNENRGIASTWNEGLYMASGKYMAIAASDDIWIDNKLERQMAAIEQNPECVVWSEAYIIDSKGKDTGQLFTEKYKGTQRNKNGNLFYELLRGNFICPQTLFIAKDIAMKIGFDRKIAYAVDYQFLISLSRQYDFNFIPEPLVKYRMHGDNSILQFQNAWDKDMLRIFGEIVKHDNNSLPRVLKARLLSRIAKYLSKKNRHRLSSYYFFIAFKHNPVQFSYLRRSLRSFILSSGLFTQKS